MKGLGRRGFALALTVCMIFTMSMSAFGASFTDVSSSHWAYSYVQDVVDKGLFTGMSSTTFEPETAMSRAMFVQVLSNLDELIGDGGAATVPADDDADEAEADTADDTNAADTGTANGDAADTAGGEDSDTTENADTDADEEEAADTNTNGNTGTATNFTDVAAGSWYENAVNWASRNSIVSGLTETTFGPDDPVTREQMVSLLVRYAEYANITMTPAQAETPFSDAASISTYARSAVTQCQRVGLISGMGDGRFAPQGTATRAEVSVVMSKMYKLANGESLVDGGGYTVTFNSNGGSAVESQTIAEGGTVTRPTNPTRDGYSFGGWYTDAALEIAYNFSTPVTSSFTLYAKWNQSSGGGGGGRGGSGTTNYDVTYNISRSVATVTANNTTVIDGQRESYSSGTTVDVAVSGVAAGYVLDSVQVNGSTVAVTENTVTPGTYNFSFSVTADTVVDIKPVTEITGVWDGQSVYVQPDATASVFTLALPLEEMENRYSNVIPPATAPETLTIEMGAAIASVTAANPSEVVTSTPAVGDTSFEVGVAAYPAIAGDFGDWNSVDLTVVMDDAASTTYNISLFASAAWKIEVGTGGYLTIVENVPNKKVGTIAGGTSHYGVTDLADIFIEIVPDAKKAGVLTVADYSGTVVAPVSTVGNEYTFDGSSAAPDIRSVTYTVKADFQDKVKAEISDGTNSMGLVADQYGGYIYVYVPQSDMAGTSVNIEFPVNISGFNRSLDPMTSIAAADLSANGSILEVDFPAIPSLTPWGQPEITLTDAATGVTYYISFYPSAVWNIDVGANGSLIIFEDASPQKAGVLDGPLTQIGSTEVQPVTIILRPDAGYEVDTFTITDVAGAAVSYSDKPVNTYQINAISATYVVEATFITAVADTSAIANPTFNGESLYWEDDAANLLHVSIPLVTIQEAQTAGANEIQLEFGDDVTAAIVSNPAIDADLTLGDDLSVAYNGKIVTVTFGSDLDDTDFDWTTPDVTVTTTTGTYDVSFFAAAVWNMDIGEGGYTTISETPTKEGFLIGPAKRSYYGELDTTTITVTPIAGKEIDSISIKDGAILIADESNGYTSGVTVSAPAAAGEIVISILGGPGAVVESTTYDVKVTFK